MVNTQIPRHEKEPRLNPTSPKLRHAAEVETAFILDNTMKTQQIPFGKGPLTDCKEKTS
jgi:hypothetical protein